MKRHWILFILFPTDPSMHNGVDGYLYFRYSMRLDLKVRLTLYNLISSFYQIDWSEPFRSTHDFLEVLKISTFTLAKSVLFAIESLFEISIGALACAIGGHYDRQPLLSLTRDAIKNLILHTFIIPAFILVGIIMCVVSIANILVRTTLILSTFIIPLCIPQRPNDYDANTEEQACTLRVQRIEPGEVLNGENLAINTNDLQSGLEDYQHTANQGTTNPST